MKDNSVLLDLQLPVDDVENRINSVIHRIDKLGSKIKTATKVKESSEKKSYEMQVFKLYRELLQLECRLEYYSKVIVSNKNRDN